MLLIVFTFFVENFQILLFKNDYHKECKVKGLSIN